nr:hypothetical protein [Tanacetum cinerariifolium]
MQGTKTRFKMARLLFRMFRVDILEVRETMHEVQVQLVIGELRTEFVGNKMHKAFPLPVIEFGDSYKVPATVDPNDTNTTSSADAKSGRTVTITTEDMQRKKNDVKARTTLLLSLSDEHQLRFSKYKTAKELWAAILKTLGGNEATKKRKKNILKQQYRKFKAEGSETFEQTFNRLQVIHTSGEEDGNTACVSTASTTFPTASASVATIS